MKVLIVFFLLNLFIIASSQQKISDEQRQRIEKYRNECVNETQVNPGLIEKAGKGDFVDDPNLKCFAKCFYQRAGFINEKGDLLMDVIRTKIPKYIEREKALKVIEMCKDRKGVDACERVFLVHKCYYENSRELYTTKDD